MSSVTFEGLLGTSLDDLDRLKHFWDAKKTDC